MRFSAMSRRMDIRLRAGLAVAFGMVFGWMLLVSPAVAVGATCAKTETVGSTVKVTCEYTGNEQEFKVPAGVTSVHVVAIGSEGEEGFVGVSGGLGGLASGDLTVKPEQVLYVEVGGVPFNGGGRRPEAAAAVGHPTSARSRSAPNRAPATKNRLNRGCSSRPAAGAGARKIIFTQDARAAPAAAPEKKAPVGRTAASKGAKAVVAGKRTKGEPAGRPTKEKTKCRAGLTEKPAGSA